jgi:hypothetical protein
VKHAITVSVDSDLTSVTIRVAYVLGSENVRGLLTVISRASRTLPDLSLRRDLEHLYSTSGEALQLLHQSAVDVTPRTVLAFNPPPRASVPRLAA